MTEPESTTQRQVSLVRVVAAAALSMAPLAAPAQGAITLYGGARAGGDFYDTNADDAKVTLSSGGAFGVSYDWILADGRQAQIFYSYQRSALPGSLVERSRAATTAAAGWPSASLWSSSQASRPTGESAMPYRLCGRAAMYLAYSTCS